MVYVAVNYPRDYLVPVPLFGHEVYQMVVEEFFDDDVIEAIERYGARRRLVVIALPDRFFLEV